MEGTIRFASGLAATGVATTIDAPDRETAAAGELVEYLFRISGKRLDTIEIADVLGVSERTVQRRWRLARAKLFAELSGAEE